MRTWGVRRLIASLCLSCALLPAAAHANGAFPASGQVLSDPTDPAVLWISSTFGVAKTSDGGASFRLLCEPAIGYFGGFHPFFAVMPSGAIFGGLPDGLSSSRGDTCIFVRAPELEGLLVPDVSVDSTGRALAIALPDSPAPARVYASTDDLASWQQVGVDLPAKLVPLTIDAAPSDPSRIYVTAISEGDTPVGMLCRTTDGGATWSSTVVPGSSPSSGPFLGGVDPSNPDRLYVRLNGAPGRLLVSDDGGVTFEQAFETLGFFRAFDLSADGAFALMGGDQDGLYRLDTTTLEAQPLSSIAARCVNVDGARVYACGTPAEDGFAALVSRDGGATFEGLFDQACLAGMLECPTGTSIGDECPSLWPEIADLLGTDTCLQSGSGSGGAGTGATSSAASGFSASATGGSSESADDAASSGCACSGVGHPSAGALGVLVLLSGLSLRRAAKRRSAPETLSRPRRPSTRASRRRSSAPS